MTQKAKMFKGQQKKKITTHHAKSTHIRKGKRVIKPCKSSKDLDANRELTKFINNCNEMKAATVACKEGGHLRIVKPSSSAAPSSSKK